MARGTPQRNSGPRQQVAAPKCRSALRPGVRLTILGVVRRRWPMVCVSILVVMLASSCGSDRDLRRVHPGALPYSYRPVEASALASREVGPVAGYEPVLVARLSDFPRRVGFGDKFSFVVTLTNTSGRPATVDPCPFYGVSFGNDAVVRSLSSYLPCEDAFPLPGHMATRFTVEMRAPSEPFSGDGGGDPNVEWVLYGTDIQLRHPLPVGSALPVKAVVGTASAVAVLAGVVVLVARRTGQSRRDRRPRLSPRP